MSGFRRKAIRFIYGRVLHADDSPHRIALGAGLGTFVAFTPTVGFQTIISLAVAAAFRANKAICIPPVWITNPLTLGPIYWFCWRIGAAVLPGGNAGNGDEVLAQVSSVARVTSLLQVFEWSFWSRVASLIGSLGAELWVGCAIVGLAGGGFVYGICLWAVSAYRRRRHDRIIRRDARRSRRFLANRPDRTPIRVRESA
ncbi:MAG: DUF2062 domain-containing protein [Phycisphaerae bacterium]